MTDGTSRTFAQEQRRWDDEPAVSVRTMVLQHDADIDALKAWRSELRGALALAKIALGSSIVSGLLAAVAIADLLTRPH